MAIFPEAIQVPGNNGGRYVGGPWRIVWHTTEGFTAENALEHFRATNHWPHFTVDTTTVYQHVDTDEPSRALENHRGGVETNRWHAVQIELVAFSRKPKPSDLLVLAGRLARWIEQTHGVPMVWPAGFPPANAISTPRMQNRRIWRLQGGHYGHCHVPENNHGDPGHLHMGILMALDPAAAAEKIRTEGDFPRPSERVRGMA